jgi:hypothetical protein
LETERKKFGVVKKQHENYLKLMQSLYIRSVRMHSTYSKQNVLLHQVHNSLSHQRETEAFLESECAKLKVHAEAAAASGAGGGGGGGGTTRGGRKSNANDAGSSGMASAGASTGVVVTEVPTPLLRVHLQNSCCHVLLYVGQRIPTPMGLGTVTTILPESKKLVLKLPFGLLYAHLARAVSWCSAAQAGGSDLYSIHGIQQHFQDHAAQLLTLPPATASAIRQLICQHESGGASVVAVAVAGAGGAGVAAAAAAAGGGGGDTADEGAATDSDGGGEETSEESGAEDSGSAVPSSQTTQKSAPAAVAGDSASEQESNGGNIYSTTTYNRNNRKPFVASAAVSSSATSAAAPEPALAAATATATASAVDMDISNAFPLVASGLAAHNGRSAAKSALNDSHRDNYTQILLESLPLAFAPPGTYRLFSILLIATSND